MACSAHGPKHDSAINDRPVIPFARNLETAITIVDELGINDASEIVDQARQQTEDEPESELDQLRKGSKW